jgi:hypothetical protein
MPKRRFNTRLGRHRLCAPRVKPALLSLDSKKMAGQVGCKFHRHKRTAIVNERG